MEIPIPVGSIWESPKKFESDEEITFVVIGSTPFYMSINCNYIVGVRRSRVINYGESIGLKYTGNDDDVIVMPPDMWRENYRLVGRLNLDRSHIPSREKISKLLEPLEAIEKLRDSIKKDMNELYSMVTKYDNMLYREDWE